MSGNILDSIDGALRDWETSGDAMRWQPPEQQLAPPRGPVVLGTLYVAPAGSPPESGDWQPVEGIESVSVTLDLDREAFELAHARLRGAQVRAERARRQALEDMAARWCTAAQQWGVTAAAAERSFRQFWSSLPTLDDLTRRHWRPGRPRRYRPPEWWRYPSDDEHRLPPHLSSVCTGWLCGSCTDRSCAHTCHGGHLR